MGCALANALGKRDIGVVVVERGDICSGSSGKNAGGVRQQFSTATNAKYAKRSIEGIRALECELGADFAFRQSGYLFLASTDATMSLLERAAQVQNAHGIPTEVLSPGGVADRVPMARTDDVVGGSYCPTDGYLDPHSLVSALAANARRSGVTILEHERVVEISARGGSTRTVATESGRGIDCRVICNTAGVWAPDIAMMLGMQLPIRPWRSQLFVLTEVAGMTDELPMVIDFDNGRTVFHPFGPDLLVGSDAEGPGVLAWDTAFEWDHVAAVAERVVRRIPSAATAQVSTGWAGLLELTPDDNPIVGWLVEDDVYVAAGFSGHGLSLAPGIADDVAAELMGEVPALDMTDYRPARFEHSRGGAEALSLR